MCQQSRTGYASLNRPLRRCCLVYRVATATGHLGTNMANNLETLWNVFQDFADIIADVSEAALTDRTAMGLGGMQLNLSRQVRRQR